MERTQLSPKLHHSPTKYWVILSTVLFLSFWAYVMYDKRQLHETIKIQEARIDFLEMKLHRQAIK